MDLEQVDILAPKAVQRGVDGGDDVFAGEPAIVRPGPIGKYTFVAST